MTERELLVDCLRRLNGAALTYYLTGSMASNWGIGMGMPMPFVHSEGGLNLGGPLSGAEDGPLWLHEARIRAVSCWMKVNR